MYRHATTEQVNKARLISPVGGGGGGGGVNYYEVAPHFLLDVRSVAVLMTTAIRIIPADPAGCTV